MATEAKTWKSNKQGIEVTVPSGNVCLARRVGMEVFLQQGMIPNTLLPIVRAAMSSGEAPDVSMESMDDGMLQDIISLVNAVCVYIVQEPVLRQVPPEGELRDDDVLYVDEVDLDDKMFLFNWAVGGTADAERFREESNVAVEHLRSGSDVGSAPELPSGDQ